MGFMLLLQRGETSTYYYQHQKKMMVIALLKISMFYQGNMGGVNLKLVYVYLE